MDEGATARDRSWERWLGYALAVGPTATIAVGVLVHTAHVQHEASWVLPVELLSTGVFVTALAVGLARFQARDPPSSLVYRLGLWTVGGTIYVAATIFALVGGQIAAGATISEPGTTVAIMALSGSLAGFLLGSYDAERRSAVEERERLARQLRFVNQTLRHDVRNDAMVIAGYAAALREVGGKGREIEQIEKAASHVFELTHLARAFDHVEEPVEVEATRLIDVLDRAIVHARQTFPLARIDLDPGPDRDVTVRADELLVSVFENLLRNAVQHHDHDEPKVEVSVSVDEGTVRVRVADDGPGIPRAVRDGLFHEGVKGPSSTGSGLGLYLVRELTEAYGGQVEVEDREPRGTVFTVVLPRA